MTLTPNLHPHCPLFCRTNNPAQVDTLFLIGNGSIAKGSFPLSEALKIAQKANFFPFFSDKMGEASLSYISLDEKEMFDLLILHLKGAKPTLPSDGILSGFQICIRRLFANTIEFRKILARAYQDHSHSLSIRPNIWTLLEQHGIKQATSACVTTNWDEVVWNHAAIQTVLHIHGRSACSSSLILPTERVSERYLKHILLKESSTRLQELAEKEEETPLVSHLMAHYDLGTSSSVGVQMARAENQLIEWLGSAPKIVIAGTRFNDYDHELIATVSVHKHKNLKEIILINRARDDAEEKNKVDKVAALFSCSPSIVKFLNTSKDLKKALPFCDIENQPSR